MFHYFGTAQNQRGDALKGWQVEVITISTGDVVNIYSDENSTPVIGNRVITDDAGNFDFFVESGTYSLKFYDTTGAHQRTQRYLPMYGDVAADVLTARDEAIVAQTAAEAAQTGAEAAQAAAGSARDGANAAAVASQDYFPGARSYVPQGAATGAATISTAGTGGTNGTFDLAFSGGNFAVNPTGTFTVSGGAVTAITITGPGLYIGNAISNPTLSFAASAGLTGAAGTFNTVYLKTAGQYWLTDTSPASGYLSLFQNQANAAVEIDAQFDPMSAGAAAASAAAAAAQVALLQATQTIGRPVGSTLVTGAGAANAGTYVFANALQFDANGNSSLRLWNRSSSAQTIKLRRYTVSSGTATPVSGSAWVSVTVPAGPGAFTIDTTANGFLEGEAVGISMGAAFLAYVTGSTGDSGGYYTTATVDADAFSASLVTNIQLQIGIDMPFQYVTTERVQTIEADVVTAQESATTANAGLGDLGDQTSLIVEDHSGTAQFAGVDFGGWAGVVELADTPVGTIIKRIGFDGIYVAGTATKINLKVYSRANTETAAPPTNCTLVFDQDYTLASLGLTAGATDRKSIMMEFPTSFTTASGQGLAYRWEAQDGASARVASSAGYLSDSTATASERGWYYSTTGASTYTAVASPNRLAVRVARDGYSSILKSDFMASASLSALSVAGTTVTIAGSIRRNGNDYPFSSDVSLSLAASGKERMDKIVVDRSTLAVSAVSGSARDAQLDSLEWQGATPSNAILVARARVGDTRITAQDASNFRGLIKVGTEGEVAAYIERNRRILRKVIGKAMRGGAIKLGGYGDSITAIQSSTPPYTANGTMRDRALTYLSNYPSDTLATLTLYDTGDGAGTVHTRLGWNWKIKAALENLGATVTYNNYGIGGTTSENTTNNGLDPARIAVPRDDGLDVVVIAFGMNERGQSYTYANILNMIKQFQDVGTACIVMGVPRPNANQSVSAWRMTNDQLEAAAIDGGAAYVSTVAISDDRNLAGIGVPAEALASANTTTGGNNHPGIYELEVYGDSAVMQLGLT